MEELDKITIGFEFVDRCGDNYSARSTVNVYDDIDETDLDVIGEQLSAFLRQVGYSYRNNPYIFMEDVTEDEMNALKKFLDEYRSRNVSTVEGSYT